MEVKIKKANLFEDHIFEITGFLDGKSEAIDMTGQDIKDLYFKAKSQFDQLRSPLEIKSSSSVITEIKTELDSQNTWLTLAQVLNVLKISAYKFYILASKAKVRTKQVHARLVHYHKDDVILLAANLEKLQQ